VLTTPGIFSELKLCGADADCFGSSFDPNGCIFLRYPQEPHKSWHQMERESLDRNRAPVSCWGWFLP
jgi:hypothetical protein